MPTISVGGINLQDIIDYKMPGWRAVDGVGFFPSVFFVNCPGAAATDVNPKRTILLNDPAAASPAQPLPSGSALLITSLVLRNLDNVGVDFCLASLRVNGSERFPYGNMNVPQGGSEPALEYGIFEIVAPGSIPELSIKNYSGLAGQPAATSVRFTGYIAGLLLNYNP